MVHVHSSFCSSSILLFLLSCIFVRSNAQYFPFPYTIQVGNPAYTLYPNATGQPLLPDMSTIVLNLSSMLIGYSCFGGKYAAGTVTIINGTSLASLDYSGMNVTITQPGAADIEGAIVDPSNSSHIYGIMHRENGWYINKLYYFNGVITLVESWDGGLSYLPVPNTGNTNDSIIISSAGPANPGLPSNSGTGPNWALLIGDYIYVYTSDAYAINSTTLEPVMGFTVARCLLSTGCGPGSWFRYYKGSFTSPGIGGNATALDNLVGSKVIYLNNSQLFLSVGYEGTLSYSKNGLDWFRYPSSLFASPPSLPSSYYRYPDSFYYTSLIPGYGGTTYYETEDSLYLYYLWSSANNVSSISDGARALASVQLTLIPVNNINVTAPPYIVVSLSQYILHTNSSSTLTGPNKDSWATVNAVDQRVYDYGWHIAYIFSSAVDWIASPIVPLYDCYIVTSNDHFIARKEECNDGDIKNASVAYLGTIGYLLADNTTNVPGYDLISLWRCYDTANEDHYIAPVYGCQPTDAYPTLLGYGLWQND